MKLRDEWEKYTRVNRARSGSEGGYLFIGPEAVEAGNELARQMAAITEAMKISADATAKLIQSFRELNAKRKATLDRKARHRARYERVMGRRR